MWYMHLMLANPIDLPMNCGATIITHVHFFTGNNLYAILNASVILKKNEKCLERNETRGGSLLLSGTVFISVFSI